MTQDDLTGRCSDLIVELGLGAAQDVQDIRALTGGVASDIAVVDLPGRQIVVKFALAKLRVAEDWHAPVHRNAAEYAWLDFAHRTCPQNAVALLGRSERLQGFAMEYLAGAGVTLWKAKLLAGAAPNGEAAKVGRLLGQLHAASASPVFDRTAFDNQSDFRALRLEPYLSFTAQRHPDLAAQLNVLARDLFAADAVLVHGDASPKNILLRDGAPILLDAECATMGDASFDPAFCLNHLILKAIHVRPQRAAHFAEARTLWEAYVAHVDWEPAAELAARVAALLPALMLARVDGKSPVEYLSAADQDSVRRLAKPLIAKPPASPTDLIRHIEEKAPAE